MRACDLPDHPDIEHCERTGLAPRQEERRYYCPQCGEELPACEEVYIDRRYKKVVGCGFCMTSTYAEEVDEW